MTVRPAYPMQTLSPSSAHHSKWHHHHEDAECLIVHSVDILLQSSSSCCQAGRLSDSVKQHPLLLDMPLLALRVVYLVSPFDMAACLA